MRSSSPSAALRDIANTLSAKCNDVEQKHYVFQMNGLNPSR